MDKIESEQPNCHCTINISAIGVTQLIADRLQPLEKKKKMGVDKEVTVEWRIAMWKITGSSSNKSRVVFLSGFQLPRFPLQMCQSQRGNSK
jgi:hypothetical protein